MADTLTAEPSSDVSKAQGSVANDMTDNSALGSKQQDASLRNGLRTTTNVSPPERSGVTVDSRSDVHFKLPKSTSSTPVPASVASIRRSIINMSAGHAFAVLSVKDVSDSLLLCEEVNGAAHVTNVKRSVIVVTCHQFRMHDCNNVDVYLGCSSVPIIENCHGIRFSHISDSHVGSSVV